MSDPAKDLEAMIRNLAERTGRTLDQWVQLARASGETRHGGIVKHLKTAHGLGHGYASLVAHTLLRSAESDTAGVDDLVAAQYTGAKAALRPWYDTLHRAVAGFGTDVEFAPKKAYVSLRRSKQFGLIQPGTATRLDVGLALKGVSPAGRLEAAGSWNAMCSHRVRVEAASAIDAALIGWLRRAYDAA